MESFKIYHNKKILYFVAAVFFVLVLLIACSRNYFYEEGECSGDEDCVLQQVTCCPCNMGGKVECMTKKEAEKWREKLRNCGKVMCIALYNCKNISCKCVEGKCVAG